MNEIKLFISDCDGVLTDGKIIYNNNKIETKQFHAQDGLGIKLLSFAAIKMAIITGRKSEILVQRCADLHIELLFQNVKNKLKRTEILLKELGIGWENVAYIGDDWNDFPVIEKVALSACPADAPEDFSKVVDYITSRNGGKGAVREFIEFILKRQNIYDEVLQKFISYLKNH
jgi:3-deoxy-D-manno-octulosonate 8-phosphate phosphatase (KDO 8-P phosphatase)